MNEDGQPTNLEEVLDRMDEAGKGKERVSVGALISVVGRRSFGPLILLAGLVALSPLSGIPGVSTTVAAIVVVVAGQVLIRRKHFWLPKWVLQRTIPRKALGKAMLFLRKPAKWTDKLLRRRLNIVTREAGVYAIAVICVIIAVLIPPMELIPFSATTAGAALTAFGLSLIAQDGLLAIIAMGFTGSIGWLLIDHFFMG